MKKVILFIAVVSAFSFASCKKDHVCTCTTTSGGQTTAPQATTYPASSESQAMAHCLNKTGTYDFGGQTITWSQACSLK